MYKKIGPTLPTDEPSETRQKPSALFSHMVSSLNHFAIHVLVRFPPTEFANLFVLNNAS
jgi:hypothetical protein